MRTHIHLHVQEYLVERCYASVPGAMINTHKLKLAPSRKYFHGYKGVRAIRVLLYTRSVIKIIIYLHDFELPGYHSKIIIEIYVNFQNIFVAIYS